MSNIAVQIGDLGDEISKTVQGQSEAGHQATRDVDEAKAAIRELFEKIRDMKAKAEQSEVMVQEICRDIKQLDFAKRHLQTTITALKRLHMLVTAVDQLQGVAKAKHYRESANLLDAVRQLLTHFESYSQVRGVRSFVICRNWSEQKYLRRYAPEMLYRKAPHVVFYKMHTSTSLLPAALKFVSGSSHASFRSLGCSQYHRAQILVRLSLSSISAAVQ
ncbi:unnamed protein product [Ectocarpus sp. 12 AP-2014]